MKPQRAYGISVIVPSYRGVEHIGDCLGSLLGQTLDDELYEIVVVLNGPDDGSADVVHRLVGAREAVDVKVVVAKDTGASNARNLGLAAASRQYLTFVDDDDWVSARYLEALLDCAGPGRVGLADLRDVVEGKAVRPHGYLSGLVERGARRDARVLELPSALSFNACKVFPAEFSENLEFDPRLPSGEDVVFFTTMFARHRFDLRLTSPTDNATYFRRVRHGSVSRQTASFDFSVEQRLQVIERLHNLLPARDDATESVVRSRMDAQADFIARYIGENPSDRPRVVRRLDALDLPYFPYRRLNTGLASTLVISFCFAPSSDTSAAVMAKRVRARGQVVDVVSNDMSGVRQADESLSLIAAPYIANHIVLDAPPHFSSWSSYDHFRRKGIAAIDALRGGEPYSEIYSRVMWPASHFLAAEYKLRHNASLWIAEFSDPLSRDIEGRERAVPVSWSPFLNRIAQAVAATGLAPPDSSNALVWAEYVALSLADTILFTNQHQMDYMLSYQPETVRNRVLTRACISQHPTLPEQFYSAGKPDCPSDTANIAYFGSFYKTRGLDDVLTALEESRPENLSVRLHIFTNTVEEARDTITARRLEDAVIVRPYVPYREFLRLCASFDCLIVNDASTADTHPINPYLPSKWSDYRGSGRPVWGIIEEGSILGQQPLDYRTSIGDSKAALGILRTLAN